MRITIVLVMALLSLASLPVSAQLGFEFQTASPAIFSSPHDIELSSDGRQLLVSDVGNHRIAVLDSLSLELSGEFANGEISSPHDVVLGPNGLAWIADTGNHRIVAMRWTSGSATEVLSLDAQLRKPEGVVVHDSGAVYASGAGSNNVVKYVDGKPVASAGGFSAPHDLVIDAQGLLWVADANNNRIIVLDQHLKTVRELVDPEFNGPRYLAFDSKQRLYVADKYSHNVKIYDQNGKRIATLGDTRPGKGEGVFTTPEGVVLRGVDLWISDTGNNRIVRYRVLDNG